MTEFDSEHDHELRRHKRVELTLPVFYLLEDGNEENGVLLNISAGGIAIRSTRRPPLGERVIAYVESVGRLAGKVVRHLEAGFAIEGDFPPRKRERIANTLTWHLNKDTLEGAVPLYGIEKLPAACAELVLADGTRTPCEINELSLANAQIEIDGPPPVGTIVGLGQMTGRIARSEGRKATIEFDGILHPRTNPVGLTRASAS